MHVQISTVYKGLRCLSKSLLRCYTTEYRLPVRKMSAEEKLDKILSDVAALAHKHEASQRDLKAKLNKLEQDMTAAQEDATERALKRSRRDRPTEFNRRGHKEQFDFNEEVDDRLDAAARKMRRLAPSEADKKLVQEAIDEL